MSTLIGQRAPLGRAALTFNLFVGVLGLLVLAVAMRTGPPSADTPPLVITFLGLLIFARLMRFEVPPNITASLAAPLQIASIVLLGPVTTALLAMPAFLAEVLKERALRGLHGTRQRAMVGIIAFNLGMEVLMILAAGAAWNAWRPEAGVADPSGLGLLALLAAFATFKLVNEAFMVAGHWLRGIEVQEYLRGARTSVLVETLTLPIGALMVMVWERLHLIGFGLFVLCTVIAAIVVRILTRARAGLAAVNADLERKVREIEALSRIGQAISADIELDSLLDTIYRRCRDILVANHFFIALYNEGEGTLQIALEIEKDVPQEPKDIPLGEGLTSHVITSRAALLIEDLQAEQAGLPVVPLFSDNQPSRSWLGVPMIARGECVGAIVLQEQTPRAYDADDLRVLSAIASQAGISVKNARLHREALRALRVEEENRQLKRLNAKKSEFVNMVAHQFRTPLTAVIGYANLLVERVQKRGSDVPDLERHLRTVHGESKRLSDMVEELLNLSRIRSGRLPLTMQRFDLARMVRETIVSHQLLAEERGIVVTTRFDEEPMTMEADSNFIRHAFANVLGNALKYAPDHTSLTVSAEALEDSVILEIEDAGPGVPSDDLDRIFDEFYRAAGRTSEKPGTGLGLSICRGIVEAHGGKCWAERRGSGTAFRLLLPREPPAGLREALSTQPELRGATRS